MPNTNERSKLIPISNVPSLNASINASINNSADASESFVLATSFGQEIKLLSQRCLLISIQMLSELGAIMVAMIFVGQLPNSALYLSGVGFARTFVNVTGTAMAWGFTTSLFTLIPQAIGAGHIRHASIHIQRAFYIVTIVSCGLGIVQLYAGDIMVGIGQPAELKPIVNTYCRLLIPYIFILAYCSILQRLLQALDMNKALTWCSLLMFACSPPLTWFFMYYLECGYYGAALAQISIMFIWLCTMLSLLFYKGYGFMFIPLPICTIWTADGMYQYIALAIPGLFQNAFEWIIVETAIILAGYVADPTIALSTTVILNNLFLIVISFSVAICNATNIRVGKYIGKGSLRDAKRATYGGLIVTAVVMICITIVFACGMHVLPRIYTDNPDTIRLTSQVMYILIIFSCANLILQTVGGVYRGLGIQKIAAIFVFVCYWIIALPCSSVLLFVFDYRRDVEYGITVIWGGLAVGNSLAAMTVVLYLWGCADWKRALQRSTMRIRHTIKEYQSTEIFNKH